MRLGILGGGQLAMMMIKESSGFGIEFIVVDPADNPPASKYAKHIQCGRKYWCLYIKKIYYYK